MNTLTNLVKRFLFRAIYKIYLWSSECSGESYLGSRLVEYPFVIENLSKLAQGSKVLLVGCAGDSLTTILCALGYETCGLDKKFVPLKYLGFKFVQGDIRRTTFPD